MRALHAVNEQHPVSPVQWHVSITMSRDSRREPTGLNAHGTTVWRPEALKQNASVSTQLRVGPRNTQRPSHSSPKPYSAPTQATGKLSTLPSTYYSRGWGLGSPTHPFQSDRSCAILLSTPVGVLSDVVTPSGGVTLQF